MQIIQETIVMIDYYNKRVYIVDLTVNGESIYTIQTNQTHTFHCQSVELDLDARFLKLLGCQQYVFSGFDKGDEIPYGTDITKYRKYKEVLKACAVKSLSFPYTKWKVKKYWKVMTDRLRKAIGGIHTRVIYLPEKFEIHII